MITEALIVSGIKFVVWIIGLLPDFPAVQGAGHILASVQVGVGKLLQHGFAILPSHCWDTFVVTVIAVKVIQFIWVIIEFVLKKVPGVN